MKLKLEKEAIFELKKVVAGQMINMLPFLCFLSEQQTLANRTLFLNNLLSVCQVNRI